MRRFVAIPSEATRVTQTNLDGSGRPLITLDGAATGVTLAVVKGFGGSPSGAPIRYAQPLLKLR